MLKRLNKALVLFLILNLNHFGVTNSQFLSQAQLAGNTFSATCWLPPSIPVLVYPTNNYYAGIGSSWDLNPRMDWENSTTSCPLSTTITYQYEIYSDPGLTTRLYQSDWLTDSEIPAPGTPDGTYYWRVRSTDNFGHQSDFSSAWKLTVDRTRPTSELSPPADDLVNHFNFDLDYTGSDTNIDYVQLCYSFNLHPWDCSHPEFRDTPHSPGTFHFTSPEDDGVYYFATIAHDLAGNIEDKTLPTDSPSISGFDSVQVDTQPPTTNLNLQNLPSPVFSGQNLVQNGNFSSSLTNWQIAGSGDHQVVVSGVGLSGEAISPPASGSLLQLGFKDTTANLDGVYQIVPVPDKLSANLSFWFRSFSNTTVDNDQFRAEVRRPDDFLLENILATGSLEQGSGDSWTGDSGWRQIGRSLLAYAGQTIKLWFGVQSQNPAGSNDSWTYLNDVRINTLDLRIGETSTIVFDSHDTGSGVLTPPSSTVTSVGENPTTFQSTDIAGNVEATHSSNLVVLPNIVLNKIAFNLPGDGTTDLGTVGDTASGEYLEVYNNTSSSVDLTGWFVSNQLGQTLPVTPGLLPSHTGLTVYRQGNPDFFLDDMSDIVTLHYTSGSVVDVTKYLSQHTDGEIWQRTPAGIGTWGLTAILPNPTLSLDGNLVYRSSVHKITMSLSNLPSLPAPVTYEIKYTSGGVDKGIFGSLVSSDWVDQKVDRDFYLGVCSGNGTCLPDSGIGTSAILILTQDSSGSPLELLNRSFNLY